MEKAERWLQDKLQFRFRDAELLGRALTHRSAAGVNNERLEFLGDAVLDFVISDAVFKLRPDADEGDLSRLRASLVKDTALAEIATELGIGTHLVLGSGEKKSGGHRRQSILADAIEAIFGAVFLDSGFDAARDMILRVFAQRLETLPDAADLRDPKTRLQEWLQSRKLSLPVYETVDVQGKDHRRRFSVTCSVNELSQVSTGESTSRRKAEQQAARDMLKILTGERP